MILLHVLYCLFSHLTDILSLNVVVIQVNMALNTAVVYALNLSLKYYKTNSYSRVVPACIYPTVASFHLNTLAFGRNYSIVFLSIFMHLMFLWFLNVYVFILHYRHWRYYCCHDYRAEG